MTDLQLRPGHTTCVLLADPHDKFTHVRRAPVERPDGVESATINVTYSGFTPQAQAAFQYAVNIWAAQITSPVPIQVNASWTALGAGVLGSAGPATIAANFTGAPRTNTWYPIALANKIAGSDLAPSNPDIMASFNSAGGFTWYTGTDGNTPAGQYDLVSVVLHELGHGLGFLGLWSYSGGNGSWGFNAGGGVWPIIYDPYLENTAGVDLITGFVNGSAALGTQITTPNDVMFFGPNAVASNGGVRPTIYSPSTWSSGSSMSHLNESTYPPLNPNSLMTPFLGSAEAIHDPGPITRGLFIDEGWTVVAPSPTTNDKIMLGLAAYTDGGWIAARKGSGGGYAPGVMPWTRVPWAAYNASGGGSRVAAGDVDGDGLDELVVGLDSGGWMAVLDDAAHGFALLQWIQLPWASYNSSNGFIWPAAGDIDGDGKAEIVAGLGLNGGGYFAIFNDASAGYAFVGWRQVPWAAFNSGNGSTRPAIGNLDGAGASEIVVGLGTTGQGYLAVFSGSASGYSFQNWLQVPWATYNGSNGATHPAAGDVDGDGKAELVVGLDNGGAGYVYIFNDAGAGFAGIGWKRTSWAAYNSGAGRIFPAVGDIDGDGRAEIVLGLGTYSSSGGWFELLDDSAGSYNSLGWQNVGWAAFGASGAGVFPSVGNFR